MIGPITIQQNQPAVTIAQDQQEITVQQDQLIVTIQEALPIITVQQVLGDQITIQGGSIVSNTLPFSVQATINNQTQFVLPYAFSQIICLFIMGAGQNILSGDYTISGNIVTLSEGVPVGYYIFGAGQI